jgi:hypothetical protein
MIAAFERCRASPTLPGEGTGLARYGSLYAALTIVWTVHP